MMQKATGAHSAKKLPARERFARWRTRHPAIAGVALALVCAACLCLLFYFLTFSDFSSSADFVYNQF